MLVLLFGAAARGSRRWIELPYFRFQPSELGKVLLIVALVGVRDRARAARVADARQTIRILASGWPRRHSSSSNPTWARESCSWSSHSRCCSSPGCAGRTSRRSAPWRPSRRRSPWSWLRPWAYPLLRGYQEERLTGFLQSQRRPERFELSDQPGVIASASGGKTGRGDNATQTELEFLPERHTDFIFAVIGERFGFLGAAFVLSLYALLIWRALRILTLSKNLYGTLIAGGIAAMLHVPDLRQRRHETRHHAGDRASPSR